jgi:hypothetical protein
MLCEHPSVAVIFAAHQRHLALGPRPRVVEALQGLLLRGFGSRGFAVLAGKIGKNGRAGWTAAVGMLARRRHTLAGGALEGKEEFGPDAVVYSRLEIIQMSDRLLRRKPSDIVSSVVLDQVGKLLGLISGRTP